MNLIENNFFIMLTLIVLFIMIVVFFINNSVRGTIQLPIKTEIKLPQKINFRIESDNNYGVGTFALDCLTFGGHGRAKVAKYKYDIQYKSYAVKFNKFIDIQTNINDKLNELGKYTYLIIHELERSQKLVDKPKKMALHYKENQINKNMREDISILKKITEIEINSGLILLQGSTIGGLAALGSWTLVSMFGTASTGTAISTLSGAAASKATLAWFGGGALAAGGGGIAAGTMALIDITGISMLLYCSYKSHSKAGEIEKQTELLITETSKLQDHNEYLKNLELSINQEFLILKEKFEKIKNVNDHFENILYPHGIFSLCKRNIREFINRDFYTKEEYKEMIQLFDVLDETYTFLSKNK